MSVCVWECYKTANELIYLEQSSLKSHIDFIGISIKCPHVLVTSNPSLTHTLFTNLMVNTLIHLGICAITNKYKPFQYDFNLLYNKNITKMQFILLFTCFHLPYYDFYWLTPCLVTPWHPSVEQDKSDCFCFSLLAGLWSSCASTEVCVLLCLLVHFLLMFHH